MITAIIGANYGDEGKGLAVNYFTREGKNLVVRHNGGAQSGHTVEVGDKRFVFHELSSGSFNGAATFWDHTYHPDLYTLSNEINAFYNLTGSTPEIYCDKNAKITIIDDVILNQFREDSIHKAGSCGMGIWECVCRNNAGYGIPIQIVKDWTIEELFKELVRIRDKYVIPRAISWSRPNLVDFSKNTYGQLLFDTTLLKNYVIEIKHNIDSIKLVGCLGQISDKFDNIVYESGQGLLLDGDYDTAHGTPSRTGIYNIANSVHSLGKTLDEVVYVTRTYLTRHGMGDLANEGGYGVTDKTNVFNQWQGALRYGAFEDIRDLEERIKADCKCINVKPHLLVTHTNVTGGKFITADGLADISDLNLEKIYLSDNKFTVSDTLLK